VDLYYLMDLSKSMEDDKEKLSALGDLLAETMQNITSNFRYRNHFLSRSVLRIRIH
jgi:integrin beta 1